MKKDEEPKIEKGTVCTPEVLKSCGWSYSFSVENLEVWSQAKEILFYDHNQFKILRVQQRAEEYY